MAEKYTKFIVINSKNIVRIKDEDLVDAIKTAYKNVPNFSQQFKYCTRVNI